jgi:hypothetical protein
MELILFEIYLTVLTMSIIVSLELLHRKMCMTFNQLLNRRHANLVGKAVNVP